MDLVSRIESKKAVVGVIGLGYVGLPLLRTFCHADFNVIGFDIDEHKIELLKNGQSYLKHLGETMVSDMLRTKRCDVSADMSYLAKCDVIISCVPTPLTSDLAPDLSYVERTTDTIATTLRKGQLIVLESTTYPGTTRDVVLPRLAATGLVLGQDFYLAYSPEREDPCRKDYTIETIPKLIGGVDNKSTEVAARLYSKAIQKVIPVSSAEVAESAKMLENIYRAVNIALVNELKVVFNGLGINIWEVIDGAASKPFGFQAFYPGPGLGGHCIPIDPYYLAWKAKQAGVPTRFIELAGVVNRQMPSYVVERTIRALNDSTKAIRNSKILLLGLAYKPDVDDLRESPSFRLIELLNEQGALVDYNDPWVAQTPKTRNHDFQMKSIELTSENLSSYDCVIVVTAHSHYNWQFISDHANLIIDTRNALQHVSGDRQHIHSA